MPASPSTRISESSCDAAGFQPCAAQVVLWGDSRQAKRRASGFTTEAGNLHHFKTPVNYLVSLILIEEPTFRHPSLEVVWLNSWVFLLIYLPIIFHFEKQDLLTMKFRMWTSFLAHFHHAHMNIVEKWKFDLTPVHPCNLQYSEVKNRLSWKSGCSLACTR